MWKKNKEFEALVEAKANELRSMSFDELTAIEDFPSEKVRINSRKGVIWFDVDMLSQDLLRVGVTGELDKLILWFIKEFHLSGFRMDKAGTVSELADEDIEYYDW